MIRRRLALWSSAVVLGTMGSSSFVFQSADSEPTAGTTTYEADERPLVLIGSLSNQRRDNGFDGLNPKWAVGSTTSVYTNMPKTVDRAVFRQPAGNVQGEFVSFSNWHTLSDAQQQAMRRAIRYWKAQRPGRTIGVFFYCAAGDPFHLSNPNPIPLDLNDPTATRWWDQNTLGWRLIGVDEFWLDSGSLNGRPRRQKQIRRLAGHMRARYGIKVGVEAIPFLNSDPQQGPDWNYGRDVPFMAMWRYVWRHCVRHPQRHEAWQVPDGYEVHVLMEKGRPELPDATWPSPTRADVEFLRDSGYIVSWSNMVWQLPKERSD